MPISGSTFAPTPARLGLARLGAARLKYAHYISITTTVGGLNTNATMQVGSIHVRDLLNDVPNTASFVNNGAVQVGQPFAVRRLAATLFSGVIERTTQRYVAEGHANLVWDGTCQDFTRLLNRRLVTKHYDEASATAIVLDLAAAIPGVTTGAVAAALPTVTGGIDFVDVDGASALTQIAQRIGAYWYIDYAKVLHFFLTDTATGPAAITTTTATLLNDPPVTYEEDQSQIRTRLIVTGGGSTALAPVRLGQTVIPIEDGSWYADSGLLRVNTMRLNYTALSPGGASANVVSSAPAPSSGGSAALSSTDSGAIVGAVSYRVSFASAAGETLAGPTSNTVTGVVFAAPSSAPGASGSSSLGPLVGTFRYQVTNVNSRGETTPGPTLGPIVLSAVSAPGAPSLTEVSSTIGVLIGVFNYKVSYVTPYGETLPGSNSSITLAAQTAPGAPGADTSGSRYPGPLIGTYSYCVSFVSTTGDETLGTASGSLTATVVTASTPTLGGSGSTGTSIGYAVTYVHPIWGESALSSRNWFSGNKPPTPIITVNGLPSGCGWNVYSTGTTANPTTDPLFKIAEMGVGTSSFSHTTQTGPAEGVRATMGKYCDMNSIAIGPTGTVARRIYRTKAGGSTYFLVGQIDNNSSTGFTDNTPDTGLTATAPLVNINGKQVSMTSIPTGPTGILARRIWRTKAGGASYFLIGRIDNNTGTTFTDNTPDASLTENAPLVATAGGSSIDFSSVPVGPTGTLARRIYRTKDGGSEYLLVGQISNNNPFPTFNDSTPDANLGATAPIVNTAGASAVLLSSLPSPPDTTYSRRIYRTDGGGSVHRFLAEVRDPFASTYLDTKSDNELGDATPFVATLGAVVGATTLEVDSTAALPSAGWARVESQLISWTGKGATTLTGIPQTGIPGGTPRVNGARGAGATSFAIDGLQGGGTYKAGDSLRFEGQSGYYDVQSNATADGSGNITVTIAPGVKQAVSDNAAVSKTNLRGALLTAVPVGSAVVAVPLLQGVSGLTLPIAQGDGINVLVERNDTAAQAALATAEGGGDGVVEFPIRDAKLTAVTAAARGDAELQLFSRPIGTLRYATQDPNTHSGAAVSVNIPSLGINRTFTIQSVMIDDIGVAGTTQPRYLVEASTVRFSLADALRRLL